jgi:gliding motility-associated-like protein
MKLNQKILLWFCLLTSITEQTLAQNLIPDPGFEILRGCPKLYEFDSLLHWGQASNRVNLPYATTQFGMLYNTCNGNTPQTGWGYYTPHSGNSMASIVAYFIHTKLKEPLQKGKNYRCSFWMMVGTKVNVGCWWQTYSQKLSIFGFKNRPIDTIQGSVRQPPIHTWSITQPYDTNWVRFETCFVADDNYSHFGIGYKDTYLSLNCEDDPNSTRPPFLTVLNNFAFRQLPFFIDDVEVEESSNEVLPPLKLGGDVCQHSTIVLDATKIFPKEKNINSISYKWYNGIDSPTLKVNQAGSYHLTVQKACKKVEVDFVVKNKDCRCQIFLPTAFSPNGDGVNDVFTYSLGCDEAEIIQAQLKVYGRWGIPIFQSNDLKPAWDGTGITGAMPTDIYVWVLTYTVKVGKNSETYTQSGEVNLVR